MCLGGKNSASEEKKSKKRRLYEEPSSSHSTKKKASEMPRFIKPESCGEKSSRWSRADSEQRPRSRGHSAERGGAEGSQGSRGSHSCSRQERRRRSRSPAGAGAGAEQRAMRKRSQRSPSGEPKRRNDAGSRGSDSCRAEGTHRGRWGDER